MTIISRLKTRAREVRLERLQTGAVRRDIRKQARAASFVTEREEAIKVAKERGREYARRPRGLAGFTAGLGKISAGVGRLSAATTPRRVATPMGRRKITRYVKIKGGKYKKVTSYKKGVVRRAVVQAPAQPTMADLLGGTRNGTKPKERSMMDFKF